MVKPMTADEVLVTGYGEQFFNWLGDHGVPIETVTDLNRGRLYWYFREALLDPPKLYSPIPSELFDNPGAIL